MSEIKGVYIVTPPQYVGKYCLGGTAGFCVSFTEKPLWAHRFFMRLFLGWEWVDQNGIKVTI